jgi:L-asparaginase
MPSWISAIDSTHEIKSSIYSTVRSAAEKIRKAGDIKDAVNILSENEYIKAFTLDEINLGNGKAHVTLDLDQSLYFDIISELTGFDIDSEEALINLLKELAAAKNKNGEAMVPEVALMFEGKLMRGNRTTKRNAEDFDAFASFNYPELVRAGVHLKYYEHNIHREANDAQLSVANHFDDNIVVLKMFPGIRPETVKAIYSIAGLRAVVLETFGSGNAPTAQWLCDIISEATANGIVTVNVTQCRAGSVEMGHYEASVNLIKAGVVSGHDMTLEAAVAKLMFLLGKYDSAEDVKREMAVPLRGEMTV